MSYPWYAAISTEMNCQTKEVRYKVRFITGKRAPATVSDHSLIEALNKAIKKSEKPQTFNEKFEKEEPGFIEETKEDLRRLLEWANQKEC